jgi:hypothetical protein
LLLVIASTSCSRFTRTRQCRALIAQVNPALDDVQTLTGTGGSNGTAGSGGSGLRTAVGGGGGGGTSAVNGGGRYLSAAARYERLAKDLGPMEFSSEQMAKYVAEYATVLTATAQTLRVLGAALDTNNAGEVDRATRELERLNVREHSAIARMDAWCAPE